MSDETEEDLSWVAGELSAIRRELLPAAESRALYLALDQGGTSSRAVLFDAVGREVASAHVPIATRRPAPDRVEHDAVELADSLLAAARTVCESPLAAGRPIAAAGLATQRSTVACWDGTNGDPLSPALSWQDRRGADWLERNLRARSGWIRELTGLPLSPHYGAGKLRWCLDELPEVRLALRDERLRMGPLASYLLRRLCRERPEYADPANASRTLLYDPALLDWSPALLEAFGVPASVLPACSGTVQPFGTLDLPTSRPIPLVACSGDQSAALFAFGRPDPATVFVNAGTGAFAQRALDEDSIVLPRGLLRSVVHACADDPHGALHAQEGTVNGAYAALQWLQGRVALDVRRALATLSPGDEPRPLFINGVGGLGAPWWLPQFPIEFVDARGGAVVTGSPGDTRQLVAVVESIAFMLAVNVELMQRTAPVRRIVVTGGLASCDYLCEALAALTLAQVERPALTEATARGIAYLAAGEPSEWQPVPVERRFEANSDAGLAARYRAWREQMALRGAA